MKIVVPKYLEKENGVIEMTISRYLLPKFMGLTGKNINLSNLYDQMIQSYDDDIEFVIPKWIFDLKDEISKTIDPLTGESRNYLISLDGSELIKTMICIDRSVSLWYDLCLMSEQSYKSLVFEDEIDPVLARDVLVGSEAVKIEFQSDIKIEKLWKMIE